MKYRRDCFCVHETAAATSPSFPPRFAYLARPAICLRILRVAIRYTRRLLSVACHLHIAAFPRARAAVCAPLKVIVCPLYKALASDYTHIRDSCEIHANSTELLVKFAFRDLSNFFLGLFDKLEKRKLL